MIGAPAKTSANFTAWIILPMEEKSAAKAGNGGNLKNVAAVGRGSINGAVSFSAAKLHSRPESENRKFQVGKAG